MRTVLDFSVIIPAKNEERCISACLQSIFSNSYPKDRYEVIVVDNGSDDRTVSLAESNGAQVVRIPQVTIAALRNHGARFAQGRVLVFIDADCTVAEDWLEQASRYLERKDIALFGSPPGIPENSTWVQRTWFLVRGKRDADVRYVTWLESMNMFIPHHLFLKVGGFNEDLITCEDVDISYRLFEHGKIISDINIKAVHHGEARTLKEFFKKERWRGKSNYNGSMAHGIKLRELPSLILPLYYLMMPLLAVTLWTIGWGWYLFLLSGLLWQLPICLLVILKLRSSISIADIGRLWLLYNVYYSSRSLAIFKR
ncbi:glycosyltransferase family 2 protein [Desulforhopalus sp. IMCC35007]|uniref:glycosyltransferase n=1 Tax=Desulforhopalus sp. IMCC35007 TaxID=2569543 RepID=UPI0010ADD5FF|nr:glycosyltransferase [Desulforhopalus sp. IMCC35007]TKB07422.1 glycosyltransferase [Desulforhopalus sp. IMCC35007]